MQRAIIIAKGNVQRVGYRDVVEREAREMSLTGFVENVKPYDVKIVCEGENANLNSFIELIKIKMFPIDVKELDVRFEDATGDFEYFEIKRGDMVEELGERLDLARGEMTKMIGKQDEMINTLENFKHENNENFNQLTYAVSKHDTGAQERIADLTVELSEVKVRLTRLESAVL
jgi:acylphosphatase